MKRIIWISMILLLSVFAVSCVSNTEAVQEETQENTKTAFERIYDIYRADLILDGAQSYTVVRGDFLAAITRKFYGNGNGYFFPLIMLASSDVVSDPELIEPGMELIIPNLEKNLGNPTARGRIKSFLRDMADVYEQKAGAITAEVRATTQGNTRYTEDIKTRDKLIVLSDSL
ncbi:MAG: LysM peptidoglycan-binding domain-containing protein [Spirochaetaceae bacterium]|jgi:hypothetical protein|nr:LysM peptidoglycan-binding domain-containing protein [Spirochaetaceae bacterium]